ncbi:MAG TPA: hypothetical protein VHE78_16320 [Gemmatimonadaceae bacterium]|nr:hypothetical protein [Gemmatimonadaceae bacterium]
MHLLFAASVFTGAACVVAGLAAGPRPANAQQWNDARTMALVDLAITRRAAQLADTGLTDYRANAHGYLTFLAQLGEGFPDPPKVVRTDELALEVYWRSPNQSKQKIVGRRDTVLVPTDINYHRDHLAIIQNNFPSVIRLGDGDEVLDVPHPLSPPGRDAYDFAIADSLLIRTNDRAFDVIMVKVRPKDDRQPRAVGAVYLDRANGTVVRMTFSFTRAALKDPQLEDVNVILENGLVDGRFWLPRRQEIEITRTSTWMDFPARGIIRGRWEVCCVQVNSGLQPPLFAGPEIVTLPPGALRAFPFKGGILEGLPAEVKLSENDDVRRMQAEARELVRAEALARVQRTVLFARSLSDFVRVNRVEGIAIGAGVTRLLGEGLTVQGRARYGFADRALKGRASLRWQRANGVGLSVTAGDDFREAGDEPEVSVVRNSVAAQEFGSDLTDYYRARGWGLALDAGTGLGARWRFVLERERQQPLAVHARPASGAYRPAFAADALDAWRLSLEAYHANGPGPLGSIIGAGASLLAARVHVVEGSRRGEEMSFGRLGFVARLERQFGADRLALGTTAGVLAGRDPPAQSLVFFGGPVTGPGYAFHEISGAYGLSERFEWRHPILSVPVSLGRYGHLAMPVSLAPFAQGIWIGGRPQVDAGRGGWFPALGLGVLTVFDLLRFDIARGLRGGRWTFSVDFSRELWRIL